MNKQQLASKIWESANKMRSKIEANEYKDYILGFIFYKFLSEKETDTLLKDGWSKEDFKEYLTEDDEETVKYCQKNLGYFISYNNLFSTWIEKGMDFAVGDVSDALSAFDRLINDSHKKVFNKIFDTLQTGLSKLGDTSGAQTKAIRELLNLIKVIPMDDRQDYDVLGFIYEYLISNFAANAGKKAGEFYTPHEVSMVMSEIVANHLKDREKIEIYDPTSGSGSLLINIGKCVSKYVSNKDNTKYYAQELKENTYNLTRMNLVMRGIIPDNIVTRNGDTLEDDWPYFDDSDPSRTYNPLYVDAVVSNPPYSQNWDPTNKEGDARYARYGLAPKAKADYAFLLHDLYHIKPDGIMTIVLPHGVLFRGGEEEKIRKALIENNNIDAIIGLPANIFFGTGIPTIIMVLRQKRPNTDVLIIDASKGFIKVGKNNKLQASDIKKIVDTVVKRETTPKYSKVVSKEEIRANEYNLNIPRYVDSSEEQESWDIYASMFGGIPNEEIDKLNGYWSAFPELKKELFKGVNPAYSSLTVEDTKQTIENNANVKDFNNKFVSAFSDFDEYLKTELINKMEEINVSKEENDIANNIFERLANIPLIDKYKAYQLLDNGWQKIAIDLEIIQTEGFEATKKVDPNMVVKKKDGKDEEVQDGYIGHVIPFELIQATILKEEATALANKNNELTNYENELFEIIDSMTDEEKDKDYLNDDNTEFKTTELNNELKIILADVKNEQIVCLNKYIALLDEKISKGEKIDYINNNIQNFNGIEKSKDNTFSKSNVQKMIKNLQFNYPFDKETIEFKLIKASKLLEQKKEIKKEIKVENEKLLAKTKQTIESLTNEQVLELLKEKWITPIIASLNELPNEIVKELVSKISNLANKYSLTLVELESQIKESENSLSSLIDELEGNEYDMKGLEQLKTLLKGE